MRQRTRIAPPKALAGYLWILAMAVISCNVLTLSPATPPAIPLIMTMTATQTALSVSPTATPSAGTTPAPSATPLPTDTLMPTPTESGLDELSCKVISQSIKNGAHFGPKEDFDVGWKVRNNGSATWDPSSFVFAYYSGTKMYLFSPVQLDASVGHGTTVALSASMVAPKASGSYTTVWTLRRGNDDFCHVTLRIIVP